MILLPSVGGASWSPNEDGGVHEGTGDNGRSGLSLQVFVNFAKDQSDDYHSKDSVRRKDVSIEVPTRSSAPGAAEGDNALRESVIWTCDVRRLELQPGLNPCSWEDNPPSPVVMSYWFVVGGVTAASCQSMQIIACGGAVLLASHRPDCYKPWMCSSSDIFFFVGLKLRLKRPHQVFFYSQLTMKNPNHFKRPRAQLQKSHFKERVWFQFNWQTFIYKCSCNLSFISPSGITASCSV